MIFCYMVDKLHQQHAICVDVGLSFDILRLIDSDQPLLDSHFTVRTMKCRGTVNSQITL